MPSHFWQQRSCVGMSLELEDELPLEDEEELLLKDEDELPLERGRR